MGVCILGFFPKQKYQKIQILPCRTKPRSKTTRQTNDYIRIMNRVIKGDQGNQQSVTKSLSYFSSTLKHRRAIRKEIFSSFFYFQWKRGRLLASMDAVWMHVTDQQGRAPNKRLRNNELTNQQSVTRELMGACVIDLSFPSILPARIVSS